MKFAKSRTESADEISGPLDERKFWCDVYFAALQSPGNVTSSSVVAARFAESVADEAVKAYRARDDVPGRREDKAPHEPGHGK